jgi:CBS domain-containing protein
MSEPLTAGDLCNRIVAFAERSETIRAAAQRMREMHVGCLVVVDETPAGRLVVGILTDRDIVTAVVAKELDPATLQVEDVMNPEVVTAREADSVLDLLNTMRRKALRRLPVTTADGVLAGLVTLDDLLSVLAEELRTMALAIEAGQMRERRMRP